MIKRQQTKKESKSDERPKSRLQIIEEYLIENYDMRYNSILSLPESKKWETETPYISVNENTLYRELEHKGFKANVNLIKSLIKSDFLREYNPIKEYFLSLKKYNPKKEIDYIAEVSKYVKLCNGDEERFNIQFKKFIVRCLACSLNGVVNKQAFVLVSPKQNCGKSTFCRWLCPNELSSYMQENINTDKDSHIALTENFLINMDELATLSKWDLDGLKSLMSKEYIKIRKPYDSKALNYKRIANFLGSTNSNEFLTDPTGTVRWICFEIDSIDFNYSKNIPIDRLWSQAFYLLENGFKYQITKEELIQNEQSNKKHRVQLIEEQLIQRLYTPGTKEDFQYFKTSTEILEELKEKYYSLAKDIHLNKLGNALVSLGFIRNSKRINNNSYAIYGYYLKDNLNI